MMEGFFLLENENPGLDQVLISANPRENWNKETTAKMLSSCTWRIFEKDGIHTFEEWLGNGEVLTCKFELEKEFEYISTVRGNFATCVVTGEGNRSFIMIAKDKKSGVVSEFKFNVDENGLTGTWSIPATGESTKVQYRRVGDCQGNWKFVSRSDGYQNFLASLDFNKEEQKQMQDMFQSFSLKQIGGGVWAYGDSGEIGAMHIKFGEEFSYKMLSKECTEIVTHTKDGYNGVWKIGNKVIINKIKTGKHFQVTECSIDGVPNSNVTLVYMRLDVI